MIHSLKFSIFLIIGLVTTGCQVIAQELTLFDNQGNSSAYIDAKSNTIYSWDGNAVAYLKYIDNDSYNIYDFEGNHVGWFENGTIRNHTGEIVGFKEGADTNVMTKIEPLKSVKKMTPVKKIEQTPPLKPVLKNQFSTMSLTMFWFTQTQTKSTTPQTFTYSTPASSNVTALQGAGGNTYFSTPLYQPNWDAIANAAATLQARHDALIAQGYVFDEATNQYIHSSIIDSIYKLRKSQINYAWQVLYKTNYYINNEIPKDGAYKIFFYANKPNSILYTTYVTIKKGVIKDIVLSVGGESPQTFKCTNDAKINKGSAIATFKRGFSDVKKVDEQVILLVQ